MKLEEVIALRMREAREAAGLSQEALGILAGIDEATAKVRINQYENGKHTPPMSMLEKIAGAVARPVTWFICEDDAKELSLALDKLPKSRRTEVIKSLVSAIEAES
ncbi:helix-turn-helix domain-containing protein [Methylotenera sp.]|uniref:helix-turn-helix domain-containing protein n=1 Tax=Methylotenera sp. TaxID=2051956 RepID=UPI002734B4AD|nr:helix-turn-helix transcriptional regulator [Methylotenera sp.]MDP3006627.1 helix-turn-helix transcriptional regulator [Methylotenera sp.]